MGKLALAVAGDGLLWLVVADGDCWCVMAPSGERWWQVEVGLAVHAWLGLVEGAVDGWHGLAVAGGCRSGLLVATADLHRGKNPQRFKSHSALKILEAPFRTVLAWRPKTLFGWSVDFDFWASSPKI